MKSRPFAFQGIAVAVSGSESLDMLRVH
jgi:hypothetical protein